MKLYYVALLIALGSTNAFSPIARSSHHPSTCLNGYLEDLGAIPPPEEEEVDDSRAATNLAKEDVSNYGVGSWEGFVDFNEFDGGDGQMGVAGDGNNELEKFDTSQVVKSRSMSAKNAWGTSSGYADKLVSEGMDTQRAQQLENWQNQQEVLNQRKQQRYMTDQFDQVREDEDWRQLAKFGVERNQDFDLDAEFGSVEIGDIESTIELSARLNGPAAVHEFGLRNQFMGFADFRAAFTAESANEFTVEPTEGSLMQREDTNFIIRFKPQSPGVVEGYLVIETEDFKKTWRLVGSTA